MQSVIVSKSGVDRRHLLASRFVNRQEPVPVQSPRAFELGAPDREKYDPQLAGIRVRVASFSRNKEDETVTTASRPYDRT